MSSTRKKLSDPSFKEISSTYYAPKVEKTEEEGTPDPSFKEISETYYTPPPQKTPSPGVTPEIIGKISKPSPKTVEETIVDASTKAQVKRRVSAQSIVQVDDFQSPRALRPVDPYISNFFLAERKVEERAISDPFMTQVATEESSARGEFQEQLRLEERQARLEFIIQLEEVAPSNLENTREMEEIAGIKTVAGKYTPLQETLFSSDIQVFEGSVEKWKEEQENVFERQVMKWRSGEEQRLEEHLVDWRSTWKPKGLGERIFESPIKDVVPGFGKYWDRLSGIVSVGESFAYGIGSLLGVPTGRSPPTLTGGLVSSVKESVKFEKTGEGASASAIVDPTIRVPKSAPTTHLVIDPKKSPQLENVLAKGSDYIYGNIVGEIGLALGLGQVAGKMSQIVSPVWTGSRPEKFLLQHSDWYFKRYGRLSHETAFHGIPTDPSVPIGTSHLGAEDFMWKQLMKGKDIGRKLGRVSAVGVPESTTPLIKRFIPLTSYTSSQVLLSSAEPLVSGTDDISQAFRNLLKSKRGGTPLMSIVQAPQRVKQLVEVPTSAISRTAKRDPYSFSYLFLRGEPYLQDAKTTPKITPKILTPTTPTKPEILFDDLTGTTQRDDLDAFPKVDLFSTQEQKESMEKQYPLFPIVFPVIETVITPISDPFVDLASQQDTKLIAISVPALDLLTELKTTSPQINVNPLIGSFRWTPRPTPTVLDYPRRRGVERKKRKGRREEDDLDPLLWGKQLLNYPIKGEKEMLDYLMGKPPSRRRKKR